MKTKTEITYEDMVQGLLEKIHDCTIEIEALEEEKQTAVEDFGQDGKDYDRWIEEHRKEILRLRKMIRNLQAIYREVR